MGHPSLKLLLLVLLVAAGAVLALVRRSEETIRRYTVARPLPRDRMLGAIIPRGSQAWFFKLSGPQSTVDLELDRFRELVSSVRFSGEGSEAEPTWTLPTGWTRQPGNAMRFATLVAGSEDAPLECSVTVLPAMGESADYLVANINRWREQMKLPPIDTASLASTTEKILLGGDAGTATFVNLAGELATPSSMGGMGRAPFAGGAAGALPGAAAAPPAAGTLKYEVPDGWQMGELEVARGGITVRRAAAFEVRDGDRRVEITVTSLPSGSLLSNVNRWRGQIGMEAITAEQFAQDKESIEFAGQPADYVKFFGANEAILGVIAERGAMAWFAKLQGPSELAGRERQRFEEFIRSIRLEPGS